MQINMVYCLGMTYDMCEIYSKLMFLYASIKVMFIIGQFEHNFLKIY